MVVYDIDRRPQAGSSPASPRALEWAVRMLVVAALLAAGLDLAEVTVPDHRIGTTVYLASYRLWWLPVLAAAGGIALLLPAGVARLAPVRAASLAVAAALTVGGVVAIGWIGPLLAHREATLYDGTSAFGIGVTFAIPAALGTVALLAAVLIAGDTLALRRHHSVVALTAGLGLVLCVAAVPFTQHLDSWSEWWLLGGSFRLRAVVESGLWSLVAAGAGVVTLLPTSALRTAVGRTVARSTVVVSVGGGVILGLSGWLAAATCAFGNLDEYACPYDVPVIAIATVVLVAGLALARRLVTMEDR